MVALSPPRAPRPSCDRYGHPVCTGADAVRCQALRDYLTAHEPEVTDRWSSLYRQIYPPGTETVAEDRLVEAIAATLKELETCDPKDQPAAFADEADEASRRLLKQICLAGFECDGCLVPSSGWSDERAMQEVREQLRRRLYCLVNVLLS